MTASDTPSANFATVVEHLQKSASSPQRRSLVTSVIPGLLDCINAIGQTLHAAHNVSQVGTANAFGDDQLNVDVLAEQIIRDGLSKCESVVAASSEEDPVERPVSGKQSSDRERYAIAFDPLDGSSIIAPNWTVGTIIGIWDGSTALNQSPDQKQICSILGIYGPRTTAIIALQTPESGPICLEVGLGSKDGILSCEITRTKAGLPQASTSSKTRYFAPANLRAAAEDEKYMKLVNHYISSKYTLRYSGGLVPDVVHALVKGHGIYLSPVTASSKAKLRRLYELAPIALIVQCAGGSAIDPSDGSRILARPIGDCDERAGLICGTSDEVAFAAKSLGLTMD